MVSLFTEDSPGVFLVSRPQLDWAEIDLFFNEVEASPLDAMLTYPDTYGDHKVTDAVQIIEAAARLCYMTLYGTSRKSIKSFIDNLLKSKHGSVLEHVNYGFIFTGVSRSLTHELVRHRAGFAFSQQSQRYVDEQESQHVVPFWIEKLAEEHENSKVKEILSHAIEDSLGYYNDLVKEISQYLPVSDTMKMRDWRKAIQQTARCVLPSTTETRIFVTANVRAWRHFIEVRGAKDADNEIRRLAVEVCTRLQEEAPLLFGDFQLLETDQGDRWVTPQYSKV